MQAEFTSLLQSYRNGDQGVLARLFPVVYDELRRLAGALIHRERSGHTLQATALVNEAYLKLVGQHSLDLADRKHFIAIAGRVMRQVLVDYARQRKAEKRGGDQVRVTLTGNDKAIEVDENEILAIDQALDKLKELSERQAKIAELRYFSGMDIEETAEVLGISTGTVKRDWVVAKAWLSRELKLA